MSREEEYIKYLENNSHAFEDMNALRTLYCTSCSEEEKKRIEEANKLITNYKLSNYLEEYFKENKDNEFYIKYGLYGVLAMAYNSRNGNFYRCEFISIDNDYNKIACHRYGIPAQIIYQNICDDNSPFQKYTVKILKNVCKHIYKKLNSSMDKIILDTYKDYKFVPIKFEVDYLKASYFNISGGNVLKVNYINYLDFMAATGLFQYELSHINEIHNNIEQKKQNNEKRKVIEKEVYNYIQEKHNINADDYSDDNRDESYWDGFGYSHNYHEQYNGDTDYYKELTSEHPNIHKVYRWSVATDKDVIISNFTITPVIAMFEYFDIQYFSSLDLKENIEKIDEFLSTPVECVMTLEEFIENGFKI